jgi:hypothetical protein
VNIPGAAALGTIIAGTVNLGAPIGTQTAGSGLTVAVMGTSISSPTDTSGHFELKDVPSGTIQLRFTGVSVDAGMLIAAVTENERIQVAVAVSGSTATLIAIERTSSGSADAEVKGAVSNVSGDCPALTFVVNGTTVTTSTLTQFKDGSCGSIVSGRHVEITGTHQSSGAVLAARIEIKDNAAQNDVEVKGSISSVGGSCPILTFVVNGKTIVTTASTQFKDSTCGSIAAGRRVEVKGTVQANGTILATRVEIEENEVQAEVELKGSIASIGGGCPNVTLSMNGTSIITSPATQFKNGSCTSLRSGLKIEVKGTRQANGSVCVSNSQFSR